MRLSHMLYITAMRGLFTRRESTADWLGNLERKRGHHMHGQDSRRYSSGKVRLVRVAPHDRRAAAYRKRSLKRAAVLLLTIVSLSAVCLGVFYCVIDFVFFDLLATESMAELAEEKLPEKILGEPAAVNTGDLVKLAEESKPTVPLIAIDAGHGGEDEGCSRDDVMESEVNLALAQRLSGKLQGLGFETLLIREDHATQMSLEERVEKAENAGADMYVSIHQNASEEAEETVTGIETWYYEEREGSRRLAQLLHNGAVEQTGAFDREVRATDELYVVRETSMPSCLIETGFLSNSAERQALSSDAYQEKLAEGMAQGIDLFFHPKTMYLTFDDGPSEDNTTAILDILKERNIQATFFVVGENVRKHPDVARRIVEEGHTIGVHCNNHDYKKLYKSVNSYLEDFQEAYDAVYEVTGVEVKLFRFPGGSVNAYNKTVYKEIIEKMTERGYIYFDWNASLEDAVKKSTPEALVQNAVNSTLGRKKVIMLAHDIHYDTAQCLEEIIDSFPEYEMKALTPEVDPIQF